MREVLPNLEKLAAEFDAAEASDDKWEALSVEYDALFCGLRLPSLPLWESCYGEEDRRLLNALTMDVVRSYRESRLCVDESLGQPADHIGLECAFFAHLLGVGADKARSFFDGHLRRFARNFSEALEKKTDSLAYSLLARLLRESAELLTDADWTTGEAAADLTPPACFRRLSDSEARETPDRRSVPVCGINNCGGRCPLLATVSDGCVLGLTPAKDPGATREPRLTICARGASYHRTFLGEDRLRYPLRRTGERGEARFERISWNEAARIIASENERIRERYGPSSRYVNYATGISGAASGSLFVQALLSIDGGFLGRYNSYSTACTSVATPYTYGTGETGNCAADLLNSKLIILWGHNPMESVFGSSQRYYLAEAHRRGIEIIAVDPRRSDTAAAVADRWIGIRPTTDGAMMDAMAFTILAEGLQDQEFMDRFCIGFDSYHMPDGFERCETYVDYALGKSDGIPKTPEWAEGITGVDADVIRQLARKYARAKPAALLQGFGPQRNGNGEQIARSGTMLACLTGNVGVPGGAASGYGLTRLHRQPVIKTEPNPYPGKIPAFLWTEAIVRGSEMTSDQDGVRDANKLDSDIKMIFNLAGNTLINQHSDINRTSSILRDTSRCEFIVCSDLFMTPSARFADILLPGTSMFEGENIGRPWLEGDYILYCNKSVEPLFECRFEYDWLSDLSRLMGCYDEFTQGGKNLRERLMDSYEELRSEAPDMPDFNSFRSSGVCRYKETTDFVAFRENVLDPDKCPFPTPSGKIEIFSPRLHNRDNPLEIPAIPKYVPSFEGPQDPRIKKYPLQLVGWHTKKRTHSIHDNNPCMESLEPTKLWINPEDAKRRDIGDGDLVTVFNDRGRIRIQVHVTNRVIRGVLAMSQGGWYTPDGEGVDIRGSINTITTLRPTPLAKGNPQHSNLVDIERYVK
jgi:anaerobic dimethyl sulfoxide reductase subunit A